MQSKLILANRERSRGLIRLVPAMALLGLGACSSSSHGANDTGTDGSGGGRGTLSSGTGATTSSTGSGGSATTAGSGGDSLAGVSGTAGAGAGTIGPTPTSTGGAGTGSGTGSDSGSASGGSAGAGGAAVSVGPDAGVGASPSPSTTPITPIVRGPDPTMASASTAGPYTVKTYTSGYKDEPNFGAATIYYPTDAEAPFGAVAICPGFTATQSSINTWGPFLASHGIVVMTIDTNTTGDSVVQRSTALMDALDCLKSENTRSGGPLMGKLDTARMGLMGWSMGGGGTWIDANTHPELKTAITLAGHIITAPGGTGAIKTISVPTLMFAGQTDSAILGGGMSQPIYTQIPDSVPKMLYEIAGLGHDAGNNPANNSKNVGLYGLSWQKVFLEGDQRYKQFLLVKGPNASDFRTNLK
jgi:dienelactone hydrolase